MRKTTMGSLHIGILIFITALIFPTIVLATDLMKETVNMRGVAKKTIIWDINTTSTDHLKFTLRARPHGDVEYFVKIQNSHGKTVLRLPNSGWSGGWTDVPCIDLGIVKSDNILYKGKVIIELKNTTSKWTMKWVDAKILLHLFSS